VRAVSYRWWGRPGYEHFYYFSTPLWRWWKFKGLIHWPRMPRPVEHRALRALDVFLHYTGYAGRYRRRLLKAPAAAATGATTPLLRVVIAEIVPA
jgi:hypothetical protein